MTIETLVDVLATHRTVGRAPREELTWLAAHGTLRHFDAGYVVWRHTNEVDGLVILLSGRMSIRVNRGSGQRKVMEWTGGDVTGALPYSRMTTPPGDTYIDEPSDVLTLPREAFPELIRHCHEVTAILVHVMIDRARRFTSADLRDEKMLSLGKLAAGLAHEVNNPASAALRDVKSLANALHDAEKAFLSLSSWGLTREQVAELDAVYEQGLRSTADRPLSGLSLADREDDLAEWLSSHAVDESLAEDLARSSLTHEALDRLAGALEKTHLEAALHWITSALTARELVKDIDRAATRILDLVGAVKGFTHMDRNPDQVPVDVAAGLKDTIAMLSGKARDKSIVITLDAPSSLPAVKGFGAEINQIWMNLLDNAVDAVPVNGHVTVTAACEGPDVVVRVIDDGPGIPENILGNIFDPFFTTKPVGKGTGLGLEIVRRVVDWHKGNVDVFSKPGRTEFRVSLPACEGA